MIPVSGRRLRLNGGTSPALKGGVASFNPPIGQSIANDAFGCALHAGHVVKAKAHTVIVTKLVFRQVAVKVFLRTMLVNPVKSALKQAEITFQRVRVNVAAQVFFGGVIDRLVSHHSGASLVVNTGFIRHQACTLGDVFGNDPGGRGAMAACDMEAAHRTAPFYQGHDDALMAVSALLLGSGFAPDVGFVSFDDFALAPDGGREATDRHGFTNAAHHKPGCLVADADSAVDLMGTDAFFAGVDQVERMQPRMQRHLGTFKNRVHCDGKLSAACVALKSAGAMRNALHARQALSRAAVWAHRTVWPNPRFKPFTSFFVVVKHQFVEVVHGCFLVTAGMYGDTRALSR